MDIRLTVNGTAHHLDLDPRMTLLDALREGLDLTGSEKGCDQGPCAACTVLIDGRRVLSCFVLTGTVRAAVQTIEGLAGDSDPLHPMQETFVDCDAFRCGDGTPGTIACIHEDRAETDDIFEHHIPVNTDVGSVEVLMVPEEDERVNPLGLEGVGEIGIVGVNAAIRNADFHATGRRVRRLPIRIEDIL